MFSEINNIIGLILNDRQNMTKPFIHLNLKKNNVIHIN